MSPLPLQFADPPDWLPFADAIGTLPELAVQLSVFALATAGTIGLGLVVGVPMARFLANRFGAHDRFQQFLVNLTKVVLVPVALLVGLTLGGFSLASLTLLAVLLVLLLGIALAADGLVRDVIGGFFLLVSRPFTHGDWVAVDDIEGRIEQIGVRMTKVRTFNNETITVPNSTLNELPVTNRSAQPQLRQEFHFGIAYDEDIPTAMEAVMLAAREVQGVAAEPVPEVRAVELEPSWVTLRATVWLDDPTRLEYIDTRSRFIRAVKAGLMENEIDINPEKTELSGQIGTVELDTDGTVLERERTGN